MSNLGAALHYGLFQLAMFWLCHIFALFWGLKFPFHARSFQKTHRTKYIHIAGVLIGLLVPLVPVAATMIQFSHGKSSSEAVRGGLGFGIARIPPILCSGIDTDTTFYSLILPLSLLMMVGITFVALIFWIVHKVMHTLLKYYAVYFCPFHSVIRLYHSIMDYSRQDHPRIPVTESKPAPLKGRFSSSFSITSFLQCLPCCHMPRLLETKSCSQKQC